MERFLTAIDGALKRKGLSDAAASQLAVGHAGFLKNLRNKRGGERLHPVESLALLADVLDLELSPKNHDGEALPPILGFAEARSAIGGSQLNPDSDQLFLPIPFNQSGDQRRGVAPIAFMQDWFSGIGRPPDNLSFIAIDGDHMAPVIPTGAMVLVDSDMRDPFAEGATSNVFAVSHEGSCSAHRLSAADGDMVVFTHLNPSEPAIICKRTDLLAKYRIIGQIVWSSSVVRGDQIG